MPPHLLRDTGILEHVPSLVGHHQLSAGILQAQPDSLLFKRVPADRRGRVLLPLEHLSDTLLRARLHVSLPQLVLQADSHPMASDVQHALGRHHQRVDRIHRALSLRLHGGIFAATDAKFWPRRARVSAQPSCVQTDVAGQSNCRVASTTASQVGRKEHLMLPVPLPIVTSAFGCSAARALH